MWSTDGFCGRSDWPTDQKQRADVSPWLFFFFPPTTYCFFIRAHFLKTNKADESPDFFFFFSSRFSNPINKNRDGGIHWVNDWISRHLLLKHVGTHHVVRVAPHTGYDGQRLGVCFGVFFLKAADKDIFKFNRCTHKLNALAKYFTITRWQLLCVWDPWHQFYKRECTITSSPLFRATEFVISRLRVF